MKRIITYQHPAAPFWFLSATVLSSATAQQATSEKLTTEQLASRALLRRAVDTVIWGTPIVSFDAMRQGLFRDIPVPLVARLPACHPVLFRPCGGTRLGTCAG
jgi:hypothetical protein